MNNTQIKKMLNLNMRNKIARHIRKSGLLKAMTLRNILFAVSDNFIQFKPRD